MLKVTIQAEGKTLDELMAEIEEAMVRVDDSLARSLSLENTHRKCPKSKQKYTYKIEGEDSSKEFSGCKKCKKPVIRKDSQSCIKCRGCQELYCEKCADETDKNNCKVCAEKLRKKIEEEKKKKEEEMKKEKELLKMAKQKEIKKTEKPKTKK